MHYGTFTEGSQYAQSLAMELIEYRMRSFFLVNKQLAILRKESSFRYR